VIGRQPELEAARRVLESLADGPAALLLEGEPGIGKTTVWREAVALAEARGYRILASRPAPAEAKLSFSGLSDLLAEVENDVLEELPPPQRQALEVALLRAPTAPEAPEPRALASAFATVLGALAERTPVALCIDDLHWLDRPSQGVVEFALRRLGTRRIGLVASARVGDRAAALPAGLTRALAESGAERVELGPLSVAALHALISERLGRSFSRPVLVRIATAARGNPFYALEIGRELARSGEPPPGEPLPVPSDLSGLVAARIRRLPRPTKDALLTMAALSNPGAAPLDPAALARAERAGLVTATRAGPAFAHPLFAAAVYASASSAERRDLHRRLARLLTRPEERARHLALGADGPSAEIADALEDAARQARLRGAPSSAAELIELAVRLTPPAARPLALGRSLAGAEHLFHAGDLAGARALGEQVLAAEPDRALRARALRLLGEIRYHEDSFPEAIALLEEALAELGGDEPAIELRVNLAYAHVNVGNVPAAAAHARAALERTEAAGDDGLRAVALAASAITDFYLDEPLDRERLERALALEDPGLHIVMPLHPSLIAGLVLHLQDELARAADLFAGLRRRTIERGEESDLPLLSAHLSMVERRRGNVEAALCFAGEGYEVARTLESGTGMIIALAERCYGRATAGDAGGARADALEAQELARRGEAGFALLWLAWAVGFLELSLGDMTAAREALAPATSLAEARGALDPPLAVFVHDAIEALALTGELERAELLATLLEQHGRRHGCRSHVGIAARGRAVIRAASGDLAAALEAAREAVEEHEQVELPLELARSLLVQGQIERRLKRKRPARASLERALAVFDSLGAALWAERARAELARTGVRHADAGELTPTEARVAELAARGRTNRQIAEMVFLSPKTVEANLARVYRKLGVRSRAELGRAIAERERATAE
jgi:DNA-binding CsgD family transcriptional regulator